MGLWSKIIIDLLVLILIFWFLHVLCLRLEECLDSQLSVSQSVYSHVCLFTRFSGKIGILEEKKSIIMKIFLSCLLQSISIPIWYLPVFQSTSQLVYLYMSPIVYQSTIVYLYMSLMFSHEKKKQYLQQLDSQCRTMYCRYCTVQHNVLQVLYSLEQCTPGIVECRTMYSRYCIVQNNVLHAGTVQFSTMYSRYCTVQNIYMYWQVCTVLNDVLKVLYSLEQCTESTEQFITMY